MNMKIQITIDEDLMKRVDEYADSNYMSRSGFITLALTQYLNSNEMVGAITRMGLAMERIADKGEIDEQSQKELADIQSICSILAKAKTQF